MKNNFYIVMETILIVIIFSIFSSAKFVGKNNKIIENELFGNWKWGYVIDTESKDTAGIEMLTMGMANQVFSEFKKDSIYIEKKNKLNSDGFSTLNGKWFLDVENQVINFKPKDKWNTSKIITLNGDSLVIEIRKPFQLLLIRQN